MADDKDTVERAKEILVYGPIGLALYLRDSAPSFLKVFVARGRAELDERKRSVGEQLGQARTVGQDTVGQSAPEGGAPQVLRIVADGLGRVRETAEGALEALGALGGETSTVPRTAPGSPVAAPEQGTSWTDPTTPSDPGARGSTPPAAPAPGLAIPDYDELSASQVVDRLDGLAPTALDAIRAYETAHRGRATILGKIEQLGQTG
ncbi:MAG: hypothetical protein MUP97_02420 [Acidimicrobiia bacterium]|nr:hypothetical protein [Acidimicrobiia bacterium]